MSEFEICEVVITAPESAWLHQFAKKLVELGLAASVHDFGEVESIYKWEGAVVERSEGRIAVHTVRNCITEIVILAKREHPYEVPSISARPIVDGSSEYLGWVRSSCKGGDAR